MDQDKVQIENLSLKIFSGNIQSRRTFHWILIGRIVQMNRVIFVSSVCEMRRQASLFIGQKLEWFTE